MMTNRSVDSAHKGPVMSSFDVLFVIGLNELLNNESSCHGPVTTKSYIWLPAR